MTVYRTRNGPTSPDERAAGPSTCGARAGQLPSYAIVFVVTLDHRWYVGRRRTPGPGRHMVITDDLAELRAALGGDPNPQHG